MTNKALISGVKKLYKRESKYSCVIGREIKRLSKETGIDFIYNSHRDIKHRKDTFTGIYYARASASFIPIRLCKFRKKGTMITDEDKKEIISQYEQAVRKLESKLYKRREEHCSNQ